MKILALSVAVLFFMGCGVARNMEEWQREQDTFKQLDESYRAGRITEKEYFDYKARLMKQERSVNVNTN